MATLTAKQEEVLEIIRRYQMEHGSSPTLRELREELGVASDNSVLKHLTALESKGYISRRDEGPRSIGLLDSVRQRLDAPAEFKLPLLGSIPAGGPVLTEEYVQNWYAVGEDLVYRAKDSFLLRIVGDSMIDAGIFEGDLVIACSSLEPRHDSIVIALVDNMNTVKRLKRDKRPEALSEWYLQPENQKYSPIYPEGELQIQGVVTGLIRLYK